MKENLLEGYAWFLSHNLLARTGIVLGLIIAAALVLVILLGLLICVEHVRAFLTGGFSAGLLGELIYGIYRMVQDACIYKEFFIGAGILAVLLWIVLLISSSVDDMILDASYIIEQILVGMGVFIMDLFFLGLIFTIIGIPFIAFGWKSQD